MDPDLQQKMMAFIDAAKKGTGRVVIDYSSLEQLDGILARLRRK